VEWTRKELSEFKITQPMLVAQKWGEVKNNRHRIKKALFGRALKTHIEAKFITEVEGEEMTFRFGCNIETIIAKPTVDKPIRKTKKLERYSGWGIIQLWQFVLELLLDKSEVVKWTGKENFEFKVTQPEALVLKWGETKNANTMTSHKFLCYFVDLVERQYISRVKEEKMTYRFDCNIEELKLRFDSRTSIQLCQFILELVEEGEVVEWSKKENYEFKVTQVELMAWKWGENRKEEKNNLLAVDSLLRAIGRNKNNTNNPISKVEGEKRVYRFGCDIEELVGFNPCNLSVFEENLDDAEKLFGFESELNSPLLTEGKRK